MTHYIDRLLEAHPKPTAIAKSVICLLLLVGSVPANAAGIDATINAAMMPITDAVAGFIFYEVSLFGNQLPLIILWMIGAAVFFTFYFMHFRFKLLQ